MARGSEKSGSGEGNLYVKPQTRLKLAADSQLPIGIVSVIHRGATGGADRFHTGAVAPSSAPLAPPLNILFTIH